jgi:hypothetical protein
LPGQQQAGARIKHPKQLSEDDAVKGQMVIVLTFGRAHENMLAAENGLPHGSAVAGSDADRDKQQGGKISQPPPPILI